MQDDDSIILLSQAVEAIKTAILQGQYDAVKEVNRVQLSVYYAIGKYLSNNTERVYGSDAIKISEQLQRVARIKRFSKVALKICVYSMKSGLF